eukprot:c14218_g1_i1.p2 GENE.c14218_g1_i1~~c14218_g1_i1.p2  ORF type:complete len:104 (+),score=17.04 c14218_g1_i1:36-314(+)
MNWASGLVLWLVLVDVGTAFPTKKNLMPLGATVGAALGFVAAQETEGSAAPIGLGMVIGTGTAYLFGSNRKPKPSGDTAEVVEVAEDGQMLK